MTFIVQFSMSCGALQQKYRVRCKEDVKRYPLNDVDY